VVRIPSSLDFKAFKDPVDLLEISVGEFDICRLGILLDSGDVGGSRDGDDL
jgi:hypothetical protein